MGLIPHAFRRSVTLPDGETAVDMIWPVPSDDRPKHGVQAWAVLRVRFSPVLRQMVPSVHRLYTRKHGPVELREMMGSSVTLMKQALPAFGGGDDHAESEVQVRMLTQLAHIVGAELDPIIGRIFPARDVIR